MVLLAGGRIVPMPPATGWYEVLPRTYRPKYRTARAAMKEWLMHREDES